MTQLIFLTAFTFSEKRKFTQTLNVGINLPITEDALQKDDEIFTVVPRTWIQTMNIAVESKYNA